MAEPFTTPPIKDQRVPAPGVVPKNIQAWALSGLAAVMVLVIAFSGGTAPKKAAPTIPTAQPSDPNAARIQEYQRRIEEQTKKLQLEQAQILQAEQQLSALPGRAGGPGRMELAGSGGSGRSASEADRQRAWIQLDQQKREYEARFASNVALSYRSPSAASAAVPPTVGGATPPGKATSDATAGARPLSEPDGILQEADGKRYRLFEGTFLETVLTNRLDGVFAGPVNCMVTTNVYSRDGRHLLVPQGSRVLGEVRRVDGFGQERLAVFFHRLIMPDGFSVSLDTFQGLNQIGETGLRDQVNRHYLQVFGVSLAIGAIAGLGQINARTGADASPGDVYRENVAGSLSQSSLRILDRYLNVLPTLTIREGHRVKVYLSGDLLVPAYENHRVPNDV